MVKPITRPQHDNAVSTSTLCPALQFLLLLLALVLLFLAEIVRRSGAHAALFSGAVNLTSSGLQAPDAEIVDTKTLLRMAKEHKNEMETRSKMSQARKEVERMTYMNVVDGNAFSFIMGSLVQHRLLRKYGSKIQFTIAYTEDLKGVRRRGEFEAFLHEFGINTISLKVEGVKVQKLIQDCGETCLVHTYTKLAAFSLEKRFDKIVILDVDTMPLKNLDYLFSYPGPFAAHQDPSFEFNSGVFVFEPSDKIWRDIINFLPEKRAGLYGAKAIKRDNVNASRDTWGANDGDQGFLTAFFYKHPELFHVLPPGVNYLITQIDVSGGINQRYTWAFRKDRLANIHFTWPKPWFSVVVGHHGALRQAKLNADKGWSRPWLIRLYRSWWNGVKLLREDEGGRLWRLLKEHGKVDEKWEAALDKPAFESIPAWDAGSDWRPSNKDYNATGNTTGQTN